MKYKVIKVIIAGIFIVCIAVANAYALSRVVFCTEANDNFRVVFGGQTHPSHLNCLTSIYFDNVPAGTYSYSGTGSYLSFTGAITVDGVSTYRRWVCPPAKDRCCPTGCERGHYTCEKCICSTWGKPVYRFWSDTHMGHFYTISEGERNHVIITYPSHIWRYEGGAWCAQPPH